MDIQAETEALGRLARTLSNDDAEAADLVQDTWVDALRADSQPRALRPWLRQLLRNRCSTGYRAATRRRAREAATAAPPPAPSQEQTRLARELLAHVETLTELEQRLVALRYWEGLSFDEAAARLGLNPSTARGRCSRALHKLRVRLDEHSGGRRAWLAALAPLTTLPGARVVPVVPAAATVSTSSLTVGGVVAATLIWLGSAAEPGCAFAGDFGDAAEPEDLASTPPPTTDAASEAHSAKVAAKPRAFASGQGIDFDAEKHPCERPIDPRDSSTLARIAEEGREPTNMEVIQARHECIAKHGPAADYGAKEEGPDGSVDPRLSATMSLRHVYPVMRLCYTGSEPALARVAFSFRTEADRHMHVQHVDVLASQGLSADERECVRNSVFVAEVGLRDGDPTLAGFSEGDVLQQDRLIEVELKNGTADVVGGGHRPTGRVQIANPEQFRSQLGACTDEPARVQLTWDPASRELLAVDPDAQYAAATRSCLSDLLRAELRPLPLRFFPRDPDDARQSCTFDPRAAQKLTQCDSDPIIVRVDP